MNLEWSNKTKVENVKTNIKKFDLLKDTDLKELEDLLNIKNKEIKSRKVYTVQDSIYEIVEWWTYDIIPISPIET